MNPFIPLEDYQKFFQNLVLNKTFWIVHQLGGCVEIFYTEKEAEKCLKKFIKENKMLIVHIFKYEGKFIKKNYEN